jgi:hypothetical protein
MNDAIILGVLANLFFILGGFFRAPKHSMIFSMCGNISYIAYYSVIDLSSPMIQVALATLTGLLILNTSCSRRIKMIALMGTSLTTLMLLSNLSSAYDFLIIFAGWCICFANTNKYNYILYKAGVLLSQGLWIIYCLHMSDFAMLATCEFIITSTVFSLTRNFYKDQKRVSENKSGLMA